MKLYHGSQVRDFVPTFGLGNDTHDYGRGFYAVAQWYWNVPSAELCDKLPVESLCVVYPGAHDLDLMTAVEKLGRPALGKTREKEMP